MSLFEEMRKAIEEISETPTYLLGYYSGNKYHPVKMFDSTIAAREHHKILNPDENYSGDERWVVTPTTIGKGIDLINEEDERRMSEINNQKEFKYRLKHKSTGQYVSYLGVEKYERDSLLPKKIDAIEFVDDSEDAEVLTYELTALDASGKLIYSPMEKLELFYCKFFLDVEKAEDDKLYTFYSADFNMYFDEILVEDYIDEKMVITLTSNNKGKPKGTKNPDVLQMFESHTEFTRHEVSEID